MFLRADENKSLVLIVSVKLKICSSFWGYNQARGEAESAHLIGLHMNVTLLHVSPNDNLDFKFQVDKKVMYSTYVRTYAYIWTTFNQIQK